MISNISTIIFSSLTKIKLMQNILVSKTFLNVVQICEIYFHFISPI